MALVFVWIIPTIAGPTVDCGQVDPVACDRTWHQLADNNRGPLAIFPVTGASLSGGTPECPNTVNVEILWGLWVFVAEQLC
jgi:hypothetical protein